jgi:heat shock protein HtpX
MRRRIQVEMAALLVVIVGLCGVFAAATYWTLFQIFSGALAWAVKRGLLQFIRALSGTESGFGLLWGVVGWSLMGLGILGWKSRRARLLWYGIVVVGLYPVFAGLFALATRRAARFVGIDQVVLASYFSAGLTILLFVVIAGYELWRGDSTFLSPSNAWRFDGGSTHDLTEQEQRVQRIVSRMAAQASVPTPEIAISSTETPEAFTVGFRRSSMLLVLSEGLVASLSDEELAAVVAHEIGHVGNRDAIVMTVLTLPLLIGRRLSEISYLGRVTQVLAVYTVGPVALVFALLFLPVVAAFSRRRELAADRVALSLTGNPGALGSALQQIEANGRSVPNQDLRKHAERSLLSIVPSSSFLGEPESQAVALGPDGDGDTRRVTPSGESVPFIYTVLHAFPGPLRSLFETHPATDRRLDVVRKQTE